jgi:endonuclease YncB( thermonuclease family)
MAQKIWIFKLLIFFTILYCPIAIAETIKGKAIIIDGDTIHIGKNKIRLYGIDAPEIKQTCTINKIIWECGIDSSQALKNIISENEVQCEIMDIDRYRRFVAICFVKNINLSQYMVQNGWAIAYRYYTDDFINDEKIAKNNKVGIWQGKFQEPYLFRKHEKN